MLSDGGRPSWPKVRETEDQQRSARPKVRETETLHKNNKIFSFLPSFFSNIFLSFIPSLFPLLFLSFSPLFLFLLYLLSIFSFFPSFLLKFPLHYLSSSCISSFFFFCYSFGHFDLKETKKRPILVNNKPNCEWNNNNTLLKSDITRRNHVSVVNGCVVCGSRFVNFLLTSVSYPNSSPKPQAWTSAQYRTLGESAAQPASSVQLGACAHRPGQVVRSGRGLHIKHWCKKNTCMRSGKAWTTKPWQRGEWRLGFNSVLATITHNYRDTVRAHCGILYRPQWDIPPPPRACTKYYLWSVDGRGMVVTMSLWQSMSPTKRAMRNVPF